jgi:2-methylcitrate dehydratase PrpD
MELTRKLAEFVHDTNVHDIPQDVRETTKHSILDWLGSALAGLRDDASRVIIDYVKGLGGKPQATVIGTGIKTDLEHAALANGVISHALDFDDYHGKTVIHGAAACLPAILSIAEDRRRDGADILTAYVLAIDIGIRLGLGLTSAHYERGWHSTSTAGRFGATAGAAKLLRLDTGAVINAFGICGTQASGIRKVFGTMSKPFNAGKSSMDGVISAVLAEKGFTGSQDIIEGKLGVFEVFTDDSDPDVVLEGLGSKYYISDLSFKPYPSCA